jgi:hypothetical protein
MWIAFPFIIITTNLPVSFNLCNVLRTYVLVLLFFDPPVKVTFHIINDTLDPLPTSAFLVLVRKLLYMTTTTTLEMVPLLFLQPLLASTSG